MMKFCLRMGIGVLAAGFAGGIAGGGEVRLADKGEARCVIVAPTGTMDEDRKDMGAPWDPDTDEKLRRMLRDSTRDLAYYLGRMTGAKIEIAEGLPAGEKRLPIYVGAEAQKVFGPAGITMAGRFGFRVVAGKKGLGLYGESAYGTSYAIYELLHRLDCRWFMPGELGEVVPERPTLTVPVLDERLAPATEWRRMENRTADADFRRRNRMGGSADGGNVVMAQHALEGYITAEQLEANPEWRLHDADGNPRPGRLFRWTCQDVADAVAASATNRLATIWRGMPSITLSPGDYVRPTEDPEERKYDPDPRVWEPAANQWSVTDRLMMLCNRVAERVGATHPGMLFGVLAYVNYNLPPAREPVHPNVIPMIAPIDFNRHHPMNWPDHPNETWLLDMVQGWGEKADRIAYYAYGMNLAELSAPNPFITKWGTDIPIILENNCLFWAPETMGGWESMMPGFYLSIRMTFYPQETPAAILADLWTRFYGPAAEPMGRYWHRMDRAWIDANEYSGCLFGYLRMFTPEVLAGARADVNEALKLAGKPDSLEYRRVKLIDLSLTAFERFMAMRRNWAAGRLAGLADDYEAWKAAVNAIKAHQPDGYVVGGLTFPYTDSFIGTAYRDAARVARELEPLAAPLVRWQYRHDRDKNAEPLGWAKPEFDDWDWPTTHVVRETWSTIGHHNTMTSGERSGRMAYRATAHLEAVPAGKQAYVWVGSTDGSAKLFVNGRHVKYVVPEDTRHHKKGDALDAFSGYCRPAQWDVTGVIKPGANQITILCERAWLNELGTGGLMGPVVIYRER